MGDDGKEHRTVGRVAAILEFVSASSEGVRMPAIVQHLGAPRSSVLGLVNGLVACGYLESRKGRYYLGAAIGALLSSSHSLNEVARPIMRALSESVGETVMLSVRTGDTLVYVDTIESQQLIRYSAPLHQRRELYPASSGKCMLAFGRPDFTDDYIERRVPATDRDTVHAELQKTTEKGYAVNLGETIPDVASLAVPIIDEGRLVACLAIAGPSNRVPATQLDALAAQARTAAHEIEAAL